MCYLYYVFAVLSAAATFTNGEDIIIEPRIFKGNDVDIGRYPFMVSLQVYNETIADWVKFCGGTIIHPQWVLTAAHCLIHPKLKEKTLYVRAGVVQDFGNDSHTQFVAAKSLIPHENFKRATLEADIGLMYLSEPLNFTQYVQEALLPSEDKDLPDNTTGWIMGWGAIKYPVVDNISNRLLAAPTAITNIDDCNKLLFNTIRRTNVTINSKHICVGTYSRGAKALDGDSGGPFIRYLSDETPVVEGVASWRVNERNPRQPVVFTRVGAYLDWISETQFISLIKNFEQNNNK